LWYVQEAFGSVSATSSSPHSAIRINGELNKAIFLCLGVAKLLSWLEVARIVDELSR